MKIEMKITAAGPDFIYNAGDIINVPRAKAKEMVDAGAAKYAEPVVPDKPAPEAAVIEAAEASVAPKPRGRPSTKKK